MREITPEVKGRTINNPAVMHPVPHPEALARHLRGQVWLASDSTRQTTADFAVLGLQCSPTTTSVNLPGHSIQAYTRGRATLHRRFGGRELAEDVEPGRITIKDVRSASEWSWQDSHLSTILFFMRPAWLDQVAIEVFGPEYGSVRLRDCVAADDDSIHGTLRTIAEECMSNAPGSPAMVQALARQLAVLLLRRHADSDPAAGPAGRVFSAVQRERISRFIARNLAGDLSVATLADAERMGEDRYARLFRNSFGCTPHQHVLDSRIERATELLVDPSLPLALVAAETGFADQSHLTRCFKRRHGLPPGQWREQQSLQPAVA